MAEQINVNLVAKQIKIRLNADARIKRPGSSSMLNPIRDDLDCQTLGVADGLHARRAVRSLPRVAPAPPSSINCRPLAPVEQPMVASGDPAAPEETPVPVTPLFMFE